VANVLLGVTGSVAAIKTPLLFAGLRRQGHAVRVVATQPSLYFFDPAELDPLPGVPPRRNPAVVSLDEDEWPGREAGRRWQRSDPVLHIELRRWADLFAIAPLDANTLAKLAGGLADNCLTCVWRAWEPGRPVVLAPAMNTLMWEHPLTARHLRQLAEGEGPAPPDLPLEELVVWINRHRRRLRVVPPVSRVLACGDEGVGALAAPEDIIAAIEQTLVRGASSQGGDESA
jgi:phosphopantothenoylcysteine decarboxylase